MAVLVSILAPYSRGGTRIHTYFHRRMATKTRTQPRPKQPRKRNRLERLPRATEFSAERDWLSELGLIRRLKNYPWLERHLTIGLTIERDGGCNRQPGSWALAYLAFVHTKIVDVEPWWKLTTDELWRECGFAERPSYQTVWLRFTELAEEQIVDANGELHYMAHDHFERATTLLVGKAQRHTGGRIGEAVVVDGTESETHAGLYHVCDARTCPRHHPSSRKARRVKPLTIEAARARRQKAAKLDAELDTNGMTAVDDPPDGRIDYKALAKALGKRVYRKDGSARGRFWQSRSGCFYYLKDAEAGVRAYTDANGKVEESWYGMTNVIARDRHTRAPLVIAVASASNHEPRVYLDRVRPRLTAVTGKRPRYFLGDRAYAIQEVAKRHTLDGTITLTPFRVQGKHKTPADIECDLFDRDGIARCRHCGGTTERIRFRGGSAARVSFRCRSPRTPKCSQEQSLACSNNYLMIQGLWPNEKLYHELTAGSRSHESFNRHARDRNSVAGNNVYIRPKRPGVAWQQLRANASVFLHWFIMCVREDWLTSPTLKKNRRRGKTEMSITAIQSWEYFQRRRHRDGLDAPYGRIALELGYGGWRPGQPLPPELQRDPVVYFTKPDTSTDPPF